MTKNKYFKNKKSILNTKKKINEDSLNFERLEKLKVLYTFQEKKGYITLDEIQYIYDVNREIAFNIISILQEKNILTTSFKGVQKVFIINISGGFKDE